MEINKKGAGRPKMFDKKHGETKRIQVTIPTKHEKEIKKEIDEKILDKYK
jgi:hypothetical protein